MRFAIISDTHLSPAGTPDGRWNNVTRRSVSRELLEVAVSDIAAAGHDRVLLLGDIADLGSSVMIALVAETLDRLALRAWMVPGNHDVSTSHDALVRAVGRADPAIALRLEREGVLAFAGHSLQSDDGGQTCRAIDLPDVVSLDARLLVWATHYPVLSREERLVAAGLRYPGDLLNGADVAATVDGFAGPTLVLHGHLHAVVVDVKERVLQIGVPAAVEWPHAWTDATIEAVDDEIRVATSMRRISGEWSNPEVDTVLDSTEQRWAYANGCWEARIPG